MATGKNGSEAVVVTEDLRIKGLVNRLWTFCCEPSDRSAVD